MSCALEEKYMGDRTFVSLYVPTELAQIAEKIIASDAIEQWQEGALTVLGFAEVNYGELDNLALLEEAGIPYNSSWAEGGNYSPGTEFCRFTSEGDPIIKSFTNAELNPNINILKTLFESPDILINYLKKFIEDTAIIPWDNQVEYGKRYKVRQLITM